MPEDSGLVSQINDDPINPKRPVGYIRSKIFNRSILVKTLIDSGNLFADLISEKLAKLLHLPVKGQAKDVGTASATGSVKILGRTKPFYVYLEGISSPVKVHPYVVRDLAHPLNLGQAFLRAHRADMTFRSDGIQLRINGKSAALTSASAPLTQSTIDVRIKALLDKWTDMGKNPCTFDSILDLRVYSLEEERQGCLPGLAYGDNKRPIQFSNTEYSAYNHSEVMLKAGCSTVISAVSIPIQVNTENDVFLFPKKDSSFLNSRSVWVHPGTYKRDGQATKVLVTNFGTKDVRLPKGCKVGKISEATAYARSVNVVDHQPADQLSDEQLRERREYIITMLKLDENELFKDRKVKEQVIQMFLDNWDAVSISESDYGRADALQFHIQVPKGTPPVRAKVRPLNPHQEADLKRQIDDWLEAKIIEPSMSPWASALVPCVKKNSTALRWAIDYRNLNKVTVKDAYPLSSIENNLHKLSGAQVFTTLDSRGAFHTMCVEPSSRDYTTFVSSWGSYRFVRLPFGLANAPAAYSRLVAMALNKLPGNFALGYIDDVVVFSNDVPSHLNHLRQVLELHVRFGLKLNLKKCQIAQPEVEYLGHKVSRNGIAMIDDYVARILDWPLPQDAAQLKSFLGFTGYYRSFIKDYSKLTNHMNRMKKDKIPVWTEEAKANFEALKQAFKTKPVRGFPLYDTDQPFILDTDFSSTNMAAVLSQNQNGKETFLGCVAKKCDKAQQSYPSHKGELGAVILGLKKFEHILRAKPFIIRTDSRCVEFLQSMKEVRGMFARWQAFLSSFHFTTVHRSGKQQMNADPLSRRPGLEDDPEVEPLEPDSYLHDVDDIYEVQEEATPSEHVTKQNPAKVAKTITLEELAHASNTDPMMKSIIEYVKAGHKPDREERKGLQAEGMHYVNNFESLSVDEGVLYFQAPETNGEQKPKRICLPRSLQSLAFGLLHAHPMGGHYGQQSTYRRFRERFYFPGMYSYVVAMVTNCVPCVTKRSNKSKPAHAMHHEQLSYFSQRVYIDTVGELTATSYEGKTCRHFLTIMDGFSRYLVAVPVEKIDAQTLAESIVEKWVMIYGCPEVIHSDRGSGFQSKLFTEVMRRLGIVQTRTPPYSPEANRVERCHKTLGDIIRSDRRFEAKFWPQKLVAAVMAYNTTINRETGMSPYEVVFGKRATLPVDLVFPFPRKEGISKSNYVEDLKRRFSKIARQVCEAQDSSLSLKQSHYQARDPKPFQKGDVVYYFLGRVKPGLSKKLQCRWCGPFKVIKVVSESLVVIFPVGNWTNTPRELAAIVSRLRKVDPRLSMNDLNPTRRKQIDLLEILDDLDELNEVLSYQGAFDEENEDEGSPYVQNSPYVGPRAVVVPSQPQAPLEPLQSGQPPLQPPPPSSHPPTEQSAGACVKQEVVTPEPEQVETDTHEEDEFEDAEEAPQQVLGDEPESSTSTRERRNPDEAVRGALQELQRQHQRQSPLSEAEGTARPDKRTAKERIRLYYQRGRRPRRKE